METSAAITYDALVAKPDAGATAADNIEAFPQQKDRLQDIIIRHALEGTMPKDISRLVGVTEKQVMLVLNSEWARNELTSMALQEKHDGRSIDSITKLLRIHAFAAIVTTAQIAANEKLPAKDRLAAARTILYHTVPAAQAKAFKPRTSNDEYKSEQEEMAALQSLTDRLQQQLKKPI